jgi:diguanylate cyclase
MNGRQPREEAPRPTVVPLRRVDAAGRVGTGDDVVRQEVTQRVTPRAAEPLQWARAGDPRQLARQVYPLRILGLGLGFLCVAGTLVAQGAPGWVLVLLAINGFAWPHVAWWRARGSRDPSAAEFGNLAVDSLLGGVWVAVMQVALVPSLALVAMLSMDKAAVGGWRLMLRHLPVQALGFGIVWLALGRPFQPEVGTAAVLAALPLLVAYPMATAFAVHTLGRRVRDQNRALQALNRTDVLTGLGNRRALEELAAGEYHRCERSGRPAAVLFIDLDEFKTINDRHGHAFGDEVLRRVALAIRGCLREIDAAARFGGDEFAVVLPETRADSATYVAGRMRAAIAAQIFEQAPALRCTASIGVAEVAPADGGADGWMERADRALYRAKAEGRDCVRVAP